MDQFILLLVSALLLTARAAAAAVSNPVLDADGDDLRRGRLYYAMPSAKRSGGGLTVAAPNTSPCPLNVAQEPANDESGRPLAFFPENTDDDTVREGNTLYVMFPEPTECCQSTVWALAQQARVVTTGGAASSAVGPHGSRFAIRKAPDASSASRRRHYQIQVCPCSTGVARPSCRMGCIGSLGLMEREQTIGLEINNEDPHTVVFVKAAQEAAATS